jgi:hypothetical protein
MSVRVGLLDTLVEIVTEDEDARRLFGLLWSAMPPGDDAAIPARIYQVRRDDDGGWIATAGDSVEAVHSTLWGLADALRYRMLELCEERIERYVTLHAAAVARGEDLVLLAGESGAGKTTLTLALLGDGWAYLTDDLAPIAVDTALVHPFPKPLGVKDLATWSAIADAFGDMAALGPPTGSFLVPPTRWEVATEPMAPRALLFPKFVAGAPLEVERLSAAKAAAISSAYLRRLDPSTVALLNRVCSAARCVRLSYGSTRAALGAIEDVLNHRE